MPHPQQLLDYAGQVALVTGGGSGIGTGIALRLAEAGADVVVHYRNSQDGAEQVASVIRKMGQQALVLQANLTIGDDVTQMMYEAVNALGRIDVLINNAGVYPLHSLLEMDETEWSQVIDANLKSVHLCTQVAARQMQTQPETSFNSVVNIASIEGTQPAPMHAHYSSAKAAVVMHTKAAAQELGQYGIRVNCVSPGLIDREGLEDVWPEGVARWHDVVPLGRMGKPSDVADACLFLASPMARWISGVNLIVDGGASTRPTF